VKRSRDPVINLRGKGGNSVLNKLAYKLLSQDGETHVLVYVREGKIRLVPIKGDGLVGAVKIHSRPPGVAGGILDLVSALKAAGNPQGYRACVWNDAEHAVEIAIEAEVRNCPVHGEEA